MKKTKLLMCLSAFLLATAALTGCDNTGGSSEVVETAEEKVAAVKAALIYDGLTDGVLDNITLITSVVDYEDVTITYTVSQEASAYLKVEGGKLIVTRPEMAAGDAKLAKALTATITCGDVTDTKTFNIKIVAKGNDITIAEFRALTKASGVPYIVYGQVVAENSRGLLIGDSSGKVVYAFDGDLVAEDNENRAHVGDFVKVEGGWAAYGGVPQFSYSAEDGAVAVTVLDEADVQDSYRYTAPSAAQSWDAAKLDAYLGYTAVDDLSGHYIKVVGELSISGSYYNLIVDGTSSAVGSLAYPSAALTEELASLDGKMIEVTGYSLYISGGKYVNIFTTDVEEVTLDDAKKAEMAASSLTVASTATANFVLPSTGTYEAAISWSSSNSDALAIGAKGNDGYPVTVNRGSEDVTVTLTASATVGSETKTATYTVTVPAAGGKAWTEISDTYSMTSGETVTFRGYYQGHNNKIYTYNSVDQWNAVFVADGADWIQVYQGAASYWEGINKGDAVEVTGTIAHYDNGSYTTYEVKPTKVEKVTDTTDLATPVSLTLNANSQIDLAVADINKAITVSDAVVVSSSANNYGNLTIVFTVGTKEYTLYLDSRYTDVEEAQLANLKAGDTMSFTSWVGAGKGSLQLIYINDLVVAGSEGGDTPVVPNPDPVEPGTTQTITLDFNKNTNWISSSYNATEASMTVEGIEFGYLQLKQSGYSGANFMMLCKDASAYLYNKTAIPGKITSIEFLTGAGASATAVYYASLSSTAKGEWTSSNFSFTGKGTTATLTAEASDNYSFFNLSLENNGKNGQITHIVISYIAA